MCVANKVYLEALPEALPGSIAEVACGCNLPAELACPEASRWEGPRATKYKYKSYEVQD